MKDDLAPSTVAAINRLATAVCTVSSTDRVPARRLVFLETFKDFRAKYPELPSHEIASAVFKMMKVLDDRIREMDAAGAGGEGQGMTDEIISLASVFLKLDQTELPNDDLAEIERRMEALPAGERVLVVMAYKLMSGSPYAVVSDNPETFAKACALAQHMGASADTDKRSGGLLKAVFQPPQRH